MPNDLWTSISIDEWQTALQRYERVLARQNSERLPELDHWYRVELPFLLSRREPSHITLSELVEITRWKMLRGVWRGRNLALVKRNSEDDVKQKSQAALESMPHPTQPIRHLSDLAGVGPATASAVLAAAQPMHYPFFDECVAAQIPEMGELAYTVSCYDRYAAALRLRAGQIGSHWNPVMVERCLWANVSDGTALETEVAL